MTATEMVTLPGSPPIPRQISALKIDSTTGARTCKRKGSLVPRFVLVCPHFQSTERGKEGDEPLSLQSIRLTR
eukprot:1537387-Rhodomonas_salina.1